MGISGRQMRILHAPNNICGQAYFLAAAQRKLGYFSNSMSFARNSFSYPVDICLELQDISERESRRGLMWLFFCESIEKYDIFHFHFKETLLIPSFDLPILKMHGKKIIRSYWGSEIRLHSIASKINPQYNMFGYQIDENEIIKRINFEKQYIDMVVVPDLEIYNYARYFYPEEKIKILPISIDLSDYKPEFPRPDKKVPLIVHAPSNRGVKGTEDVIKIIEKLRNDGYHFDFKLVEGQSHKEALQIYSKADIVIDQLLLGLYGFVGIESMALGKPVLCYIKPEYYSKEKYEQMPVIKTDRYNLYNDLKELILDASLRFNLGCLGRLYVEKYHDIDKIARELVDLYEKV